VHVADRKGYLLVEKPHNVFVDLREVIGGLCRAGL
jgi:hypothetical protein